jgi:hypothetical protein
LRDASLIDNGDSGEILPESRFPNVTCSGGALDLDGEFETMKQRY